MYLTKEEERIYDGEAGESLRKAMEILVALGDINEAPHLIPIKSAHVSGASYKTIGDAYEFVESLDARVKVQTTLNPIGMDKERWRELGVSKEFALKQMKVLKAYEKLGVLPECTCTPYLIGYAPERGEHISWAESSAVIYVNSVLGARTNLEGAPSALAAALVGKTPLYGLHLDEERAPSILFDVECELSDAAEYGALGYLVGKIADDNIPLFKLKTMPNADDLKALSAALGATGSVGMFHAVKGEKGITPEALSYEKPSEVVEIEKKDIKEFFDASIPEDAVLAFGCPHCSTQELRELCRLLRSVKSKHEVFVFVARRLAERENAAIKELKRLGVRVVCDTCMVVSPAFERFSCIATNSAKAFRYVPSMCGAKALLVKTSNISRCFEI